VVKAAAVVGVCGGVLAGSGGEGSVGDMVATGMSGNGRWCRTVVGGVVLWVLGIKKRGRGDENKKSKGCTVVREEWKKGT